MNGDRRRTVVLVTDAIYPYSRGGKELRYHEIAQRLAHRADVQVVTMKWWTGPSTRSDGQVTYRAISRLHPMYSGERRSYREALFFALACFRLLPTRFDELDADQFPSFHIFTLRLVTWLRRKRLIVTWHEVWGPAYWRQYLGWLGRVGWLVEWFAMRVPDELIAASPQTAARLREILGPRTSISVVPNGIDLEAISDSYPDGASVDLVTVGRLLPHKNVEMLLESVALLHAAGSLVTCRVIGEGPQRAALLARARDLGIDHAVDFRPDVWEQKELYALMKAARVAVFPTAREGFGIAVLEAIACCLPVVTTSAPDNLARHLVGRSALGVVCDPTPEAIVAAVRRLLEDGADGSADRPRVQEAWLTEYGWDVAADQVAQVFGL